MPSTTPQRRRLAAAALAVASASGVAAAGTAGATAAPAPVDPAAAPTTTVDPAAAVAAAIAALNATTTVPAAPAPAPSAAPVPSAAPAPASTAPVAPAPAPAPAAGALPENATLDQIKAASLTTFGPQADLNATLAPYNVGIDVPLLTPVGTDVYDFATTADLESEGTYHSTGWLEFSFTDDPAAVATQYQQHLTSLGYTLSSDGTVQDAGSSRRAMEFRKAGESYSLERVLELTIQDGEQDLARLSWRNPSTATQFNIYNVWSQPLALPVQAPGRHALLGSVGFDGPRITLETNYEVPNTTWDVFQPQVVAAFPNAGFELDPEDIGEEYMSMLETGAVADGSVALYEAEHISGMRLYLTARFNLV